MLRFSFEEIAYNASSILWRLLKIFAKCSAANHTSLQDQNRQDPSKAIVWNNKFICIGGKSVYFRNLAEKGILTMGE